MTHNPDNPHEHGLPAWQLRKLKQYAPRELRKGGPLEWQQGSRWHLVTGCGYYTIAKALVRGTPSYGSWFRPMAKGSDIPIHLGEHASVDLAKAHAQLHADMHTSPNNSDEPVVRDKQGGAPI